MNIQKTEKYTLIKPSQNSVNQFITEFKKIHSNFEKEHLIIDFSDKINFDIKEILLFLDVSALHYQKNNSFVIVCNGIDFNDVPENINVVPTLVEAIDIIEMEAIERDLGF